MPTKTITRATQRQIAALLSQAAGALAGASADPALLEALSATAADLAGSQAPQDLPAGRTVSLKHAHDRLCNRSFLDGARIVTGAKLSYDGQPLWAIYSDLRRVLLHSGEVITGLSPETRLARR